MFCKKNKAIISIRTCIIRQDIIARLKANPHNKNSEKEDDILDFKYSSFRACFECKRGMKIKENPNPNLDKDVQKLIRFKSYFDYPPERYELTHRPIFVKYVLKPFIQMFVKKEENE
jgi:hypothetical protein